MKFRFRDFIMLGQNLLGNIKMPISCFLEDIDRSWKLQKNRQTVPNDFPMRGFHVDDISVFEIFKL